MDSARSDWELNRPPSLDSLGKTYARRRRRYNAFKSKLQEKKIKNPVKFYDTFIFQFVNPKGVFAAITSISLFVELGDNYLLHSIIVVTVSFFCAITSITSWCLLGKFLKRFSENKKFIQVFNYTMSFSLVVCVILIYLKI